jgi:hypothetical protein
MTIRLALVAVLVTLTLSCASSSGEDIFQSSEKDSAKWMPLETSTLRFARIGWSNASAPFKRILLIRDGEFLCAVRFVNFRRGGDKTTGSVWSSGDETLISAYEWYVLEHNNERARVKSSGKATVKSTALSGIGRFVIAGGSENIRCGERKFGWDYPSGISFSQVPGSDMKLAPTRWESAEDIKLDDPKLTWYPFDQKREPLRIRLENL